MLYAELHPETATTSPSVQTIHIVLHTFKRMEEEQSDAPNMTLPRVAITYCTQCKWMLRAGYFGQEVLSTFGTTIGEVALIPATGGIFTVHLTYTNPTADDSAASKPQKVLIWDRKTEGGFPETKILKQKIRNHIDPAKNLGHSDTPSSKGTTVKQDTASPKKDAQPCEPQQTSQVPSQTGSEPVATKPNDCEECS